MSDPDIRFEWDAHKADTNVRKHGISFETAIRVFADPFHVSVQDRVVDGERRWQTVGLVEGRWLLLVAHTWSDEAGMETVRLISARPATKAERRRYEEENG